MGHPDGGGWKAFKGAGAGFREGSGVECMVGGATTVAGPLQPIVFQVLFALLAVFVLRFVVLYADFAYIYQGVTVRA